jgi:hypothetical protein
MKKENKKESGRRYERDVALWLMSGWIEARGANDAVIVTDIKRRGEKAMRIVNIYNQ